MNGLGELLKRLKPIPMAVAFLLALATVSFSLGATSVRLHSIPSRLAGVEASQDTLSTRLETYIQSDSLSTWRNGCILERMATGQSLSAFDCNPDRGIDNGGGE